MKFKFLLQKSSLFIAASVCLASFNSNVFAQNTCADAVIISSIPYSSGTLTTCGTGNDYPSGSYGADEYYGEGEDYVYQINITTAPVTYGFALGGDASWKILDVNSSCSPSSSTSIGGFVTSWESNAMGNITFPSNGTYYIYIDTYPSPFCGEFTLDITSEFGSPLNDEMSNATVLTVNSGMSCDAGTAGTTFLATASSPETSCNPDGANDDVWYQFVATASTHILNVNNTGGTDDINMVVYASDGLSEVAGGECDNVSAKTLTGLTIGETYYVRIYTWGDFPEEFSSFVVCLNEAPPPPVNDLCINSKPLDSGTILSGEYTTGSNEEILIADCGWGAANDVWYSVEADADGDLTVLASTSDDIVLVAYEGDCGTLIELDCVDDVSSGEEVLTISAVAGQTYYFRVYQYDHTDGAVFDIVASGTPLSIELGEISAVNKGNLNEIKWNSLKEDLGDVFVLERSADGRHYSPIVSIDAKGVASDYSYNDATPILGLNYYRIHLLNTDGRDAYSKVVLAEMNVNNSSLNIFPNPSSGKFTIQLPVGLSTPYSLSVHDISGKIITTVVDVKSSTIEIDLNAYPSGVYFIKYGNDVFKLIKE